MPRFKLLIEYAGTRYSGWQIQKNARTVQGEIDRAVREVSKRGEFELYGSGRTDAGVHALAQVAHLELYTDLPPESLRRKLNDELPADIHIRAIDKAPHRFHARHDAVSRCYLYQISRRRTAFAKPFVWWIREPLDVGGHARGGCLVRRHEELRGVHRRRSRREVDARARRSRRDRRSRRAAADSRPGVAFSVEDGAEDGRRAGRRRPRRPEAAGCRAAPRRRPKHRRPLPRHSLRRPPDSSSRRCSTKATPVRDRSGRW